MAPTPNESAKPIVYAPLRTSIHHGTKVQPIPGSPVDARQRPRGRPAYDCKAGTPMSHYISRRRFLTLAAGLPALGSTWGREPRADLIERTLTAAPLSGGAWAYHGSLPGPTLEAFEGERLRVLFHNYLPQPSTIHWHGLSIPADQDGGPHDPVPSGASRWYDFTLPAGSAGTYWYHPHVHGTTWDQVRRGLAGLLLVRAHDDPLAASGIAETSLFVTEMRGMLVVNGRLAPHIRIRQGETQRWRVVNATPGRYLRLALEGRTFTLAGTD